MKEITEETEIEVKRSDGHDDKWCLVHDGERVVQFAEPGSRTGTPARNTMLVGSEKELQGEIEQLGLGIGEEVEPTQ